MRTRDPHPSQRPAGWGGWNGACSNPLKPVNVPSLGHRVFADGMTGQHGVILDQGGPESDEKKEKRTHRREAV